MQINYDPSPSPKAMPLISIFVTVCSIQILLPIPLNYSSSIKELFVTNFSTKQSVTGVKYSCVSDLPQEQRETLESELTLTEGHTQGISLLCHNDPLKQVACKPRGSGVKSFTRGHAEVEVRFEPTRCGFGI